jgi:hypothetical protein
VTFEYRIAVHIDRRAAASVMRASSCRKTSMSFQQRFPEIYPQNWVRRRVDPLAALD